MTVIHMQLAFGSSHLMHVTLQPRC